VRWPWERGGYGVGDETYTLWRWNGKRLARIASFDLPGDASMTQDWVAISSGLTAAPRTIVSRTTYYGLDGETLARRGELLRWVGTRPARAVYRLPSLPVAIGDFRGVGHPVILMRDNTGRYTLAEPAARTTLR
jgi:hypothetical protein